ncbi:MAG TPA: oligosaccharide flippase family protein [Vicinamibacterales bacterium]|jgi:O-antigen/teichoic acid export membrane protein
MNESEAYVVARNVSTRYLAILAEMAVGLIVLPFNVAHLGKEAYGLWMLTTSVTAYFSVLDLGYSGAQVRFVAHYRAKRDITALNEILSTMFCAFSVVGIVTYAVAIVIAVYLGRLFHLSDEQVRIGRVVLLVVSANVAGGTAFSVFGGVINGFQRYDLNNVVGAISSVIAAVVNVVVLLAGYGLIELVVATTAVRLLTYWVYRANAYRVFPELQIRITSFRQARLKEVTSFSVYMLAIDWANKINYSVDAVVIGMMLDTGAVALFSVGQRLAETTQRLTNQLNDVLFPNVVHNDTAARDERLRRIFLVGTRLSLATVIPLAGTLILLGGPILHAWLGKAFGLRDLNVAVVVLQILAVTVIVRVGNATACTLLKGAGHHRLLAFTNVGIAIANLSLSVALIHAFSLVGVALGTLIPVTAGSMFILFPAGCRRVGVKVRQALIESVWPAAWPAVVMVAWVELMKPWVRESLTAVGSEAIASVALYAVTFFFFGTSTPERELLYSKLANWRGALPLPTTASTVSEDA